jgi:osomolarity two-component system sensor histidine kinase SLN1
LILPAVLAETKITDTTGVPEPLTASTDPENQHHLLSTTHLSQHNLNSKYAEPFEFIVVRIEVTDTGCGIKTEDMAQSKLFCEYRWLIQDHSSNLRFAAAFNQTEQGRQQGSPLTDLQFAFLNNHQAAKELDLVWLSCARLSNLAVDD